MKLGSGSTRHLWNFSGGEKIHVHPNWNSVYWKSIFILKIIILFKLSCFSGSWHGEDVGWDAGKGWWTSGPTAAHSQCNSWTKSATTMCNWLSLYIKQKNREHHIKSFYIYYEQTLTADLAEQILKSKVCLETEVEQVVVKAYHAIHKWYGNCFSNCVENATAERPKYFKRWATSALHLLNAAWSDALFFAVPTTGRMRCRDSRKNRGRASAGRSCLGLKRGLSFSNWPWRRPVESAALLI